MPKSKSIVEGYLKHVKYKQAKKRHENREKRKVFDKERDRQFPQSTLEVE